MIEINDSNYRTFINAWQGSQLLRRGYRGAGAPVARLGTFEDMGIPLIPESEWDDHIRERERSHATLREYAQGMGLYVLNQARTNYCWVNAPTFCAMFARTLETGVATRFSPASAGARIKNFRNVGGWGSEAYDWFFEHGVNLQEHWPANEISRAFNTAENQELARHNRLREGYKLHSWQEVGSCLIAGIPVAAGYDWWLHEVTLMDLVLRTHDGIIANSWDVTWGDQGYGKLVGNRKFPDDAVALTSLALAA